MSMPSVKRRQHDACCCICNGGHSGALCRGAKGLGPGGEPFTSVGDNVLVQLSLDKGDDLLCSSAWRGSDGRCVAGARMEIEQLHNRPTMLLVARNRVLGRSNRGPAFGGGFRMLSHAQGRDADALSELTQASDLEGVDGEEPSDARRHSACSRACLRDLLLELNRPAQKP